jgi:hypothetical protein
VSRAAFPGRGAVRPTEIRVNKLESGTTGRERQLPPPLSLSLSLPSSPLPAAPTTPPQPTHSLLSLSLSLSLSLLEIRDRRVRDHLIHLEPIRLSRSLPFRGLFSFLFREISRKPEWKIPPPPPPPPPPPAPSSSFVAIADADADADAAPPFFPLARITAPTLSALSLGTKYTCMLM